MNIKRLPDTEFELMRIIWRSEPPVTTNEIMEQLKADISWKPQTVLTMLVRLIEKGFLESARVGRERNYTPIISEQDYMRIETGEFISRYSGNSVGSLVKTMYDGKNMTNEDLKELKKWLKERE
ncbi:MAG: BlaI/MecI/CopY family transcriptional regulator [Defluviitaleaceae bacterium]|nr:BlaI/MecI/CopY family transcriptional regulator [Defluviitaleaceae bacterium]